jgi:hypothetical protein
VLNTNHWLTQLWESTLSNICNFKVVKPLLIISSNHFLNVLTIIYHFLQSFSKCLNHYLSFPPFISSNYFIQSFSFWFVFIVHVSSLFFMYKKKFLQLIFSLIGGVIVNVLVPQSSQTKDYNNDICCFSSKHAALRRITDSLSYGNLH